MAQVNRGCPTGAFFAGVGFSFAARWVDTLPTQAVLAWGTRKFPHPQCGVTRSAEPIASARLALRRDPRNTVFRGRPCRCGTP